MGTHPPGVDTHPQGLDTHIPWGYMDLGYYGIWLTSGRYASYWNTFSLLHTNEVWGKVIFLFASVILSTRGRVSVQGVSLTETPCGQRSPWTETPQTENPLNRDPQTETPGQRPPPLYGGERAVRILLECILLNNDIGVVHKKVLISILVFK